MSAKSTRQDSDYRSLLKFAASVFSDLFFPDDFSNTSYAETKKWISENYRPWLELPPAVQITIMKIIEKE